MSYGDSTIPEKRMTVQVNGEAIALEPDSSLAALVARRAPQPPFAVEVNRRLVRRNAYADTPLHDGDVVEIVTLVGGG